MREIVFDTFVFMHIFIGEKCYRVSGARKTSERLHWSGALARCKSYGADLVSIQSQEEQGNPMHFGNI